jgi:hypothetical protein
MIVKVRSHLNPVGQVTDLPSAQVEDLRHEAPE